MRKSVLGMICDYCYSLCVENLVLLCNVDTVLMDGTFDAVPALFAQLYTLHVFKEDKLLPVVYCLLPDKTTATYNNMFRHIHNECVARGLQLDPATFLTDFESGIMPAIAAEFPNATHRGCYFHFTQAIWRQV